MIPVDDISLSKVMTPTADPIWAVTRPLFSDILILVISHDLAAGIGALTAVKAVLGQYNGGI